MAVANTDQFGVLGQQIGQSSGALGAGMGAMNATMETVGRIPLVAGWNNYRYQNTFLRGGFLDDRRVMTGGAGKFRPFRRGSMVPEAMGDGRQFVGGTNILGRQTARGAKMAEAKAASRQGRVVTKIQKTFGVGRAGADPRLARAASAADRSFVFGGEAARAHSTYKVGMFKGFRKNNITANTSAFGRFHSASVFGPHEAGFYAPHGGAGFIGGTANHLMNFGAKAMGIQEAEHVSYLSGGVIGRLGAVRKMETGRMSGRALARADRVNARVLRMNNPLAAMSDAALRS
jgi:hypothetical protein